MERIKSAVERARKERDASGFGFGRAVTLGAVAESGSRDGLSPTVTYTKTRTVHVSRDVLREKHVVSGFDPCSFTEVFKILSTQVSHIMRDHHWTTLAVTSPGEREGKTLVSINLAISLAMEFQQTCLLVEADLRQPSVCGYFGLESGPGLSDYLNSDIPIEQLLINPGVPRFVVLPGGTPQLHSSEMLGWRKMSDLVHELKTRYPSRIVVFDLPPLLAAADVLAFAPHIEATLLVVEEGKTRRDEIIRAAELLTSMHLIGTVLNKSDEPVVSVYGHTNVG
jgi:capsular exopolysaccharide synthesis family protein